MLVTTPPSLANDRTIRPLATQSILRLFTAAVCIELLTMEFYLQACRDQPSAGAASLRSSALRYRRNVAQLAGRGGGK